MRIEKISRKNVHVQKIKDEKTRLVLTWLLEFRYSTLRLLAARLGLSYATAFRFLKGLADRELIILFSNRHYTREKMVTLGSSGRRFLQANSEEFKRSYFTLSDLKRIELMEHDLGLQEYLIPILHEYREVIFDKNIKVPVGSKRPDALVCSGEGAGSFVAAIEYERTAKKKPHIYRQFYDHAKGITEHRFHGVIFVFEDQETLDKYREIFLTEVWPIYQVEGKGGYLKDTGATYTPDKIENLRACFEFEIKKSACSINKH